MLILFSLLALADDPQVEFSAGSYGRMSISSDLSGGRGESPNIVSHGPRLELPPYMEFDLAWKTTSSQVAYTAVLTPAFDGDVFHYDGDFSEAIALRNLYVEAEQTEGPLSAWVGSRMYRGDDVYLLNFWPLDDLNTTGGGTRLRSGPAEVQLHVGVNRLLLGDLQVQRVSRPIPNSVGAEQVLILDRQRTIASLRTAYTLEGNAVTMRARLYGELHRLPAGEREIDDPFSERRTELLPSDTGAMIGAQLTAYGWAPQSFTHLWLRHSTGLAAIDELAFPADVASDDRVATAKRTTVAIAGNHETDRISLQIGAELAYFADADGVQLDVDDRWEFVGAVRPQLYLSEDIAIAAELSEQILRPNGPNPRTTQFQVPHITKLSVLPGLQPGRGQYTRPRIYAQYTLTLMDQAAQDWFPVGDVRVAPTQHFVGLGAEWWINSQRDILPD